MEVDLEWLDGLTDMGFERDLAFNALTHTNSFEGALNLLTHKHEKCNAPVCVLDVSRC